MQRKKANNPISERIKALENRVNELTQLLANHCSKGPRLLTGWSEISRYTGKSPRMLDRYRQTLGFPAYRFGRHVVSSPSSIDGWLLAKTRWRRARKAQQKAREQLSENYPTTKQPIAYTSETDTLRTHAENKGDNLSN